MDKNNVKITRQEDFFKFKKCIKLDEDDDLHYELLPTASDAVNYVVSSMF